MFAGVGTALVLAPVSTGLAAKPRAVGGTAAPSAPAAATAPAAPAAPPAPPTATSGPADQITYQSARLKGEVDSGNQSTAYFFLYGTTTAYGSQSLTVSLEAGSRPATVFSQISGLAPQTLYHYRLVAINALGTKFGMDMTFTTVAAPLSMTISASENPEALGAPLSIAGEITGTGGGGSAVVLQEDPFPFTGGFEIAGEPELASSTGGFVFAVGAVPVTTQFRVVGVGPGEPLFSETLTEFVQLAVTMTVTRGRTTNAGVTITGLIRPAETGGRVTVQRLVGTQWKLVVAGKSQAGIAGTSSYSITLHPIHSGLYRVFAASVEGGHLSATTEPTTIHVHG
jgi:hypothetical protein